MGRPRVEDLVGEGAEEYRAELVRLTRERADRVALQNDIQRGKLVFASEVQAGWAQVTHSVKSKILSMPAKLAPQLALVTTPQEAQAILASAVEEVLLELAGGAHDED